MVVPQRVELGYLAVLFFMFRFLAAITDELMLLPQLCFADCVVVGDLKGYSAREADGLEISEDAVSSQKFVECG